MPVTTVYTARDIITMQHSRPRAQAVAVREGRVLCVGTLEECTSWGDHAIDDRFSDKVLVPGFVEAHAHGFEGVIGSSLPYVGWFDRRGPDGQAIPGIRSYDALIARLRALDAEADAAGRPGDHPLLVIGFDPIYFPHERRLDRHHLDQVATERPIYVQHVSGHLSTVNTAGLRRWNITADLQVDGIGREADGHPDGELREGAQDLGRSARMAFGEAMSAAAAIRNFARSARNQGITTTADLAAAILGRIPVQERWRATTGEDGFPVRVAAYPVPQMAAMPLDDAVAEFLRLRRELAHERWHFPGVKIVLDGSIQGFTAALQWPGYYRGEGHDMLLITPEQMAATLLAFHRAGVNVHIHCNGNHTAEVAIDAIEAAVRDTAWLDHRHTITHAQTLTPAQLRRMARIGICANFFTNHLWFWGDQHHDITLGPERASRMNGCASAIAAGVDFTIHSDAPVTPIGQLHTMWCAVNRVTPTGRILGPAERISAEQALRAVTLGAAYTMHLDHLVGSIESGKLADFAVLAQDPTAVEPMAIRDIEVWGTVLGGVPQPAERALS